MTDLIFIPSNTIPKYSVDPLRRDWNDFQHLSTQGRYIVPRTFATFRAPQYKLASVKKQTYNPKVPTIRHIERDDFLCRLPDEHCRHTSPYTEEQFQEFDPPRDASYVQFSGLNWHDTGKALLGSNDSLPPALPPPPPPQRGSITAFGARLRPDKSERDIQSAQEGVHRTPSLSYLSALTTISKPIKYSYRNYGRGTYDQTPKHEMWPRYHLNTKNSFDSINRLPMPSQMQNIFRSTSMYGNVSNASWK